MAADFAPLQAQVDALAAQVARQTTIEESAGALISGFATLVTDAVTKALTADDAADNGSIQAAVAAIQATRDSAIASDDKLGAAVLAGTPGQPPPTA